VPEFVEPENWPPNSSDLNPVDYSIWGALQQLVYLLSSMVLRGIDTKTYGLIFMHIGEFVQHRLKSGLRHVCQSCVVMHSRLPYLFTVKF